VEKGRDDIYHTECIAEVMPGAEEFRERASGLLAISISKLFGSYVLWFRPEVVQTVTWAGNPNEAKISDSGQPMQLHPRRSFENWKEILRGRSLPWSRAEIEGAVDFRNSIVGIVLRKAEELATLSAELQRSNKELESFSYSVSHDLRAPFRHIVGYAELLKDSPTAHLAAEDRRYLDVIIDSAYFAGDLVDNLLNYSRIGRTRLDYQEVDMATLVQEVIRDSEGEKAGRSIEFEVGRLPPVHGDLTLLRVVWQNLVSNAIKYTRESPRARVEISAAENAHEAVFSVKDNGVGFDPLYQGKLFGVFQRLHRVEEFEGTGIGLANVRRIVSRHGGKTWAEGVPGEGATFYFSLPKRNVGDEI
jgi:light-regulated signal transduction histidine kinase (bacteriophytochrome)